MSKEPFTPEEKEIIDLLVDAHTKFVKLNPSHPNDITDWTSGIHKCQSVMQGRVVARDYPDVFYHIKD